MNPGIDLHQFPFAVYSDVHADEASFKNVLALTPNSVKHKLSLGDVVGYGNNPSECVDLEMSVCDVALKGNHDDAITNSAAVSEFSADARQKIDSVREKLSAKQIQHLHERPLTFSQNGFVFSHGALSNPLRDYVMTEDDANRMFDSFKFDIAFVGHSHIPGIFERNRLGKISVHDISRFLGVQRFNVSYDSRYVIVVPSVTPGRNRYNDPGFLTYNPQTRALNFIFHKER